MQALYHVALFVHVLGVSMLFAGDGVTYAVLKSLQNASTSGQVRVVCGAMRWAGPLHMVGPLMILAGGLYMVATAWGWTTAWIDVALVSFAVASYLGHGVSGKKMKALAAQAAAAPDGPIGADLAAALQDRTMWIVNGVLFAWLAAFLYLMILKPGWTVSIAAMVISTALGWMVGVRDAARTAVSVTTTSAVLEG